MQKTEELRRDLILLDIGLPKLNGIEAALQIQQRASTAQSSFLNEISDRDVVRAALRAGGRCYVLKSEAMRDLATAVQTVLSSKRFLSDGLIHSDDRN